ncbi:MAG: O-antigen ligase family protein [Methylovulum sp.]|uniref:O-antigen ligase family protein n=1 Tax=Methylovulum sp. TaxID=1916980 RepID=UPI00261B871D|nr:O-antigen ligase family protein [Methylovulum sp.]MDD2725321.1 O-antigen ligase family protein [Methylovulum sp.]MDD5126403.1 O-antigen ligase family protein [Methylovulum sp.]
MVSYADFSEKSLVFCRWLAIIAGIAAPISTAVTSVACAAMLVAWLASGEAICSLKISAGQPAGKMILVFYSWLLIGAFYADTSWPDKIDTLLSWKKLAYTFILFGLFYQAHWQRLFVKSYLTIMAIAALVAGLLWLADITIKPDNGPGIFMTSYVSQSMAFVAATICGIFLLKEPLSTKYKGFVGLAIALFVFNIFFVSEARSGYIAFPFAVVFAAGCAYGYKKLPQIFLMIAGIIFLALLASPTLQQRLEKGMAEKANYQTSEEMTSIGLRVVYAQNSIELIKKNPIWGYGTSSFKSTYSPYVAKKYSDWRGNSATDPHNQYLFVWLENGLLGLILFFAYIVAAIRQGVAHQPYGAIAASVLVAVCVSSLFSSHFKTFPEGHLLAFFVGILLVHRNPDTSFQKCT